MIFAVQIGYAGNKDRSGQAAAQHLLIGPWEPVMAGAPLEFHPQEIRSNFY
jgi:hypothetical protein